MPMFELRLKRVCVDYEYATIEIEAENKVAAHVKFHDRTPDVEEALNEAVWDGRRVMSSEYRIEEMSLIENET